ncbi:MAG TPA: aldehyde dehydrogenase family protein, partial [Reyranella sp.]|nr:aldehyde dehydrogenase family protein [Reyranella sp.]
MDTMSRTDVRHETLRIAGRKVETKARLEVRFPWDNRLVGSVPRATPELVAEAFRIAHAYKPKLTRYQRQQILLKTAELLVARKEELSR